MQRGTDFSTKLNDVRKACGYPAASGKTFWDSVIGPALHHLEQNGERFWANAANESEMVKDGIAHAIQFIDLKSDKARAAVEKLLVAHTFNSDLMVKNGVEVGHKVMDQSGKYTIFSKVPRIGSSRSSRTKRQRRELNAISSAGANQPDGI